MLPFDTDPERIRNEIIANGYSIVPDLIDPKDVKILREFWLNAFKDNASRAPVIWGPVLGEENRILFHDTDDGCLFRAYDFLWNPPSHNRTREIGIDLNRLRNIVVDVDERTGEMFTPDRYGIYLTVSYYPPGDGRLSAHQDRSDERRHWHFILPLTFRGDHFADGGNFIIDRHGDKICTDTLLSSGSVMFFDGALTHGVDKIETTPECPMGRMQMFSIPTFIETPIENERIAESIPISTYIKAKLRPLKHRLTGIRGKVPERNYFQ